LAKSRKDDLSTLPLGRLFARFVVGMLVVAFALLAVVSTASASYSAELKRYPYLTDTGDTFATLNWGTTRLSISGVVKYGEAGTESCTARTATTTRTAITVGTVQQFQWKSQLSGLSPNTEYCYRIYMATNPQIDLLGDDPSPHFKTQVAAGSSAPFSFAVFGDWGEVLTADGTNPDQANIMSQIAASGARFAITTGDNAYQSGSQLNYGDLVQTGADTSAVFGPNFWTVPGRSVPIFPAMGNHGFSGATSHFTNWPEDRVVANSNGRYLRETYCCVNGTTSAIYPSSWYAFDVGNARFYVLEAAWTSTNPGTSTQYGNDFAAHWAPGTPQFQWLQKDLATNPRPLKFAFFHYPLYSDNLSEDSDQYLHGPDSLEGLLSRYGVDVAFAGHSHIYQRSNQSGSNGLPSYATGGGGAHLEQIGSACDPLDAYGIGWSDTNSLGSACGSAIAPSQKSEVHHFLKVNVTDSGIQVVPTDSLGRTFDVQNFSRTVGNSDLSVSTTDSPDPVTTRDAVTYSLTVQNNGPDNANGVVLTDTLPAGTSYESATPSQGSCSQLNGIVSCKLGTIPNGGNATVALKLSSPSAGTITNQATVVGDDLSDPASSNNSTSESTEVKSGADMSITQSDSADPVAIGDTVTYRLTARNNGTLDASNVTVTDNLPSAVTYQSATSSKGSCSEASGTITCSLGNVANGASETVDITVTADSIGTVTNSATVQADEFDGRSANNSVSETTTVVGIADLSISKADSPDPIYAGQTLTYVLTAHNNGPSDAPSVEVTDKLPSSVAYQSASSSQGSCSQASGTVTCNLGALAIGASATIQVNVSAQSSGTVTNTATISGTTSVDRNSANDSATASTTVSPAADLAITQTDAPDPVSIGQPLTYTLTVRNNGPSGATGVTITDALPAAVTYSSATPSQGSCFQSVPGTVTCNLGGVANGGTATVQINVVAQTAGTVTNTAGVQGAETDLNTGNNSASVSTTITPRADIAVTQIASPDPATAGSTLTYTVTVRNNGPSTATGVTMTDTLPSSNITYQSATPSQGSCSQASGIVNCALGAIASGATATVTIRVTPIKQGGSITNRASATASEPDPASANNTATVSTQVKKK
jgi:uncharacterized repeat protein (TIGR01451 family)